MEMKFPWLNLHLFEGGAAAGAAAGGEGAATTGAGNGTGAADQSKAGETQETVVYGKVQEAAGSENKAAAAPDKSGETGKKEGADAGETPEERKARYEAARKEFGTEFQAEMQSVINKRFAQSKATEAELAKVNPLLEILGQKYGVENSKDVDSILKAVNADGDFWQSIADSMGVDVERAKHFAELEIKARAQKSVEDAAAAQKAHDDRVNAVIEQAKSLTAKYPGFDLRAEMSNKQFADLVNRGVDVKTAYESVHFQELMDNAVKSAGQAVETAVTENIKAKGQRPSENGTAARSAVTYKPDPSKWTKEDRAKIAKLVERGQNIYL